MSKPAVQVSVTTRHQEISYDWATGVTVDRRGNLRIWQGLRQRAFHPAGEWTKYTRAAAVPAKATTPAVFQPRMD